MLDIDLQTKILYTVYKQGAVTLDSLIQEISTSKDKSKVKSNLYYLIEEDLLRMTPDNQCKISNVILKEFHPEIVDIKLMLKDCL
jgi:hypothetical protein